MILAIDPGLQGTGWAVFNDKKYPLETGILSQLDNSVPWIERAEYLSEELNKCYEHFHYLKKDIETTIIEYPQFFNTTSGRVSACKGDLIKLTTLVGIYCQITWDWGVKLVLYPAGEWKGQLPKEIVQKRVIAVLGKPACKGFKTHIWDSVAIGLVYQGYLTLTEKHKGEHEKRNLESV